MVHTYYLNTFFLVFLLIKLALLTLLWGVAQLYLPHICLKKRSLTLVVKLLKSLCGVPLLSTIPQTRVTTTPEPLSAA